MGYRGLLLLLWWGLAGCGGGGDDAVGDGTTVTIGGSVSGLEGSLELRLLDTRSRQQLLTLTANGGFRFETPLPVGTGYEVSVTRQPAGQHCSVSGASGTVAAGSAPSVSVLCRALSDVRVSLSGTVTPASNTLVDSDLNDPNAPFASNNSFSAAQAVLNVARLQGFATATPTGIGGDRFAEASDQHDVYRVTLQAEQILRLQVADHDQFQTDSRFQGDLDLYLFDSELQLVDSSLSTTEFEQLVVPRDGEYYIDVQAFAGASRYVLSLTLGNGGVLAAPTAEEMVPHQAIVKLTEGGLPLMAQHAAAWAGTRLAHTESGRAALAHFTDTGAEAASAAALRDVAMAQLAIRHPSSYAKVQTLLKIKRLRQTPGVAIAEPNYLRYPLRVPNDSYYGLQWHYRAINLPQAWDLTTGTPTTGEVVVAVIDTGVVVDHPDLRNQLVAGYDFISDPARSGDGDGIDPDADDPGDSLILGSSSWHGTHVAGTVAAESNNNQGVAGVSWGAAIMPLRVLGGEGGTSYDILQAVRYAAGLDNDSGTVPARRADILNLSFGGHGFSTVEAELYQQLHQLGVVVVAAAGNQNSAELVYPASYDGVLSVSALNADNLKASYSNFGPAVDLAAPGGELAEDATGDGNPDGVLSTLVDDSSGFRQPIVSYYQGTSMAAPHVAGVAALMKAVYPALTAAEFDSLLQSGVLTREAGTAGRDDRYGFGILDALQAVRAARALADGGEPPQPAPYVVSTPSTLALASGTVATFELTNQGGGAPQLIRIDSDAPWLTVSAQETDASGLGRYGVEIDRSGLSAGVYTGRLTVVFDSAASVEVQVSMTVGEVNAAGVIAPVYVLLYDPATETVVTQSRAVAAAGGALEYTLTEVPAGSYLLVAGTDIDNDSLICQAGEACGAYPSLDQATLLQIDGADRSSLNFVASILAGLPTATFQTALPAPSPLPRPVENKQLPEDAIE